MTLIRVRHLNYSYQCLFVYLSTYITHQVAGSFHIWFRDIYGENKYTHINKVDVEAGQDKVWRLFQPTREVVPVAMVTVISEREIMLCMGVIKESYNNLFSLVNLITRADPRQKGGGPKSIRELSSTKLCLCMCIHKKQRKWNKIKSPVLSCQETFSCFLISSQTQNVMLGAVIPLTTFIKSDFFVLVAFLSAQNSLSAFLWSISCDTQCVYFYSFV